MGPDCLCWCGFFHKHNHHLKAYQCLPFSILKDKPELRNNFKACGCDPERGEVGIVLIETMREQRQPSAS